MYYIINNLNILYSLFKYIINLEGNMILYIKNVKKRMHKIYGKLFK
jgi:hypothetical protein